MSSNWLIAGIGAVGAMTAHPADSRLATSTWPGGAAPIMQPGRFAGDFTIQTSAALASYAMGRLTDSPRVAHVGAALFRAQLVSQTTAGIVKVATTRTRPDHSNDMSFPSGHSASMFASATVLQSEFGWKVGAPAYAAAAWVAASRMQANRHFLSDVIAGATLGILAGRAVTIGSGKNRFEMGAMAVSGGVGVSFTKSAN